MGDGNGRGRSPPRPILAVPNVTAHPSTASVPITVLLYNQIKSNQIYLLKKKKKENSRTQRQVNLH